MRLLYYDLTSFLADPSFSWSQPNSVDSWERTIAIAKFEVFNHGEGPY